MMKTTTDRLSYSKLLTFNSFEDRFQYLSIGGKIGIETFGSLRYMNQDFYRGNIWKEFRNHIIVRDNGLDLAHKDHPIGDREAIYIHHLNPLTVEELMDDFLHALDEDNVVSTSFNTHQAIHYGTKDYLRTITYAERAPNDTCPWRSSRMERR